MIKDGKRILLVVYYWHNCGWILVSDLENIKTVMKLYSIWGAVHSIIWTNERNKIFSYAILKDIYKNTMNNSLISFMATILGKKFNIKVPSRHKLYKEWAFNQAK